MCLVLHPTLPPSLWYVRQCVLTPHGVLARQVFIRLARAERAGQAVTTNSIRQMSSRRLTAGNDAHGATSTDAAAVAVDVGANKRGDDKAKAVERAMSRSGSGLAAADATPPWLKQLQQNAKVGLWGRCHCSC